LLKRVAAARPEDVLGVLSLLSRSDWGASRILDRLQSTMRGPGDARELARRRLALLALESAGGDVGARAAQLGASLAPTMMPITDWPKGEAKLQNKPRPWKSVIGQWPVQFTPHIGSELRGLSIDVLLTGFGRRNVGMGVHFAGCGEDRPWEIDLPRTDRSLGQSSDYRHGIGVGPLVVIQTSTGLHGLLPFDAAGERGASKLWDVSWIDMWGKVTTHSVNYLPRLSDVAPGRHPLDLDDFGRPLAQVGPVAASFFCYREFGRLVCCDTSTGRRRWDRASFEPDDIAVGDETAVIVVSPANRRVEVLDPLDGELVASHPVDFAGRHWRTAIETTAYLRSGAREMTAIPVKGPEEASEIVALNLKTGQRRWTRAIDPGAVEFMVGRRMVGTVDAKGIEFIDPVDGREKKRVLIEAPAEIVDVYAVDDPFAVMVCVFGKPAVEQLKPPLQLLGNRRKPYANGMVYGFDPDSLELKWSIPLEKSVFPLDQPRDLPLLVIWDAVIAAPTAEQLKRVERDVQGTYDLREDRIRCFDKRTGRQVGGDLKGEYVGSTGIVIERSQQAGWVDVRTAKGIYRFEVGAGR
jgi:hypothetical protein